MSWDTVNAAGELQYYEHHEFLVFEVVEASKKAYVGARMRYGALSKTDSEHIAATPVDWNDEGREEFIRGFQSVSYKDMLAKPWNLDLELPDIRDEWFMPELHPYDAGAEWGCTTMEDYRFAGDEWEYEEDLLELEEELFGEEW